MNSGSQLQLVTLELSGGDGALAVAEQRQLLSVLAQAVPGVELLTWSVGEQVGLLGVGEQDLSALLYAAVQRAFPTFRAQHSLRPGVRLRGGDAFRFLLRACCGLEGDGLGEDDVNLALRQGFEVAQEAATVGPHLKMALGSALRAAKRAHDETSIASGKVEATGIVAEAIAAVCVELGASSWPRVMLVGGVESIADWLKACPRDLRAELVVAGSEQALELRSCLPAGCSLRTTQAQSMDTELIRADVVLLFGQKLFPLSAELVRALQRRPRRLLCFAPQAEEGLDAWSKVARLVGPAQLASMADGARAQRQAAVPAVERIVEHEQRHWRAQYANIPVERLIAQLVQDANETSEELVRQLRSEFPGTVEDAEAVVRHGVARLVEAHVSKLRELCAELID